MRKSIDINSNVPETISDVFRQRFKIALLNDGVTQSAIADKLGVTKQAFWVALSAKRMSLPFAAKVAKAIDVSLDWLCGLEEE